MSFSFYLGLDLGQSADYSALAVIEEPVYCPPLGGWVSGQQVFANAELREQWRQGMRFAWERQAPGKPPLWLRTLHRYPLRTPYPDVVADVIRRLGGGAAGERDDAVLVIDGTGVGAAVVDMFRFSQLPSPMVKVVIHGGTKVIQDHGLHVPKRDLIGAVQALLHTERLQVAKHSTMTETWAGEMQNYRIKLSEKTGHDSYDARGDSAHDDLVLAVSLAAWYRGWLNRGE